MKLRIHFWGEKILRRKCRRVKDVDDDIRMILGEMYSLMRVSDGIGLAANQAGVDLRLIVIQIKSNIFKLVNPKIIKREGSIKIEEGCLSFPGITLGIKRAGKVWVSSLDENGSPIDIEADGILAVALQHEIDHINGVVFIDRVSFLERLKLKNKLKEIRKMAEHAAQKSEQ
ncbi:MAG: peptide deformylase [Candidatus Omnitrophica bacterium 4484_171]|nr:MAG: peptide deformylase [Candidatus Omnitrophica bacterium 4484_171]